MTEVKTMPFYEVHSLEWVLRRQINIKYKSRVRRFIMLWLVDKLIPNSFKQEPMQKFMKLQKGVRIGSVQIHYDEIDVDAPLDLGIND